MVAEGGSDDQLTHQLTQGLRGGRSEKNSFSGSKYVAQPMNGHRDKGTEVTGVAGRGSLGSMARL